MFCPNCGTIMDDHARFCSQCGTTATATASTVSVSFRRPGISIPIFSKYSQWHRYQRFLLFALCSTLMSMLLAYTPTVTDYFMDFTSSTDMFDALDMEGGWFLSSLLYQSAAVLLVLPLFTRKPLRSWNFLGSLGCVATMTLSYLSALIYYSGSFFGFVSMTFTGLLMVISDILAVIFTILALKDYKTVTVSI